MDPFQREFEDEYVLHEMIQAGTEAAGSFQEEQNEDDGSQYLNDIGDGDAETREEMHVEDDIPEVYGIRSQNMTYRRQWPQLLLLGTPWSLLSCESCLQDGHGPHSHDGVDFSGTQSHPALVFVSDCHELDSFIPIRLGCF